MDQQPHDAGRQPIPPYQPLPNYWPVQESKPKHRVRNCLIIVGALVLGLILILVFLALLVGKNSTPYPWSLIIHSGYTRETTMFGVPIGSTKYAELHVTLTNVSAAGDTLSPDDLTWTLTDTGTHETFTGKMTGNVPMFLSPSQSADISVGFQVPIASDDFTLNLSGPAGTDPTTWPVHFSV